MSEVKTVDFVYTIAYKYSVEFEWDEEKNKANFNKHEVWFEEAQTVWADGRSLEYYDPEHSDEEDRYIRVGHSTALNLLLVVFCERDNETLVRIISARKATPKERTDYEKGIRSKETEKTPGGS